MKTDKLRNNLVVVDCCEWVGLTGPFAYVKVLCKIRQKSDSNV